MVKTSSLQKFLREKAATAHPNGSQSDDDTVDWDVRKSNWLKSVANLYALIRRWLAPLEHDHVLRFHSARIFLQEDMVGSYEVEVLSILIGKQRVTLQPKGMVIVGAEGRIDIRGQKSIETIILNKGKWLAVDRFPKLKVVPFNQQLFEKILEEVME